MSEASKAPDIDVMKTDVRGVQGEIARLWPWFSEGAFCWLTVMTIYDESEIPLSLAGMKRLKRLLEERIEEAEKDLTS